MFTKELVERKIKKEIMNNTANSGQVKNVNVNNTHNKEPTPYQDKHGNFFFPSLTRAKKKKVKQVRKDNNSNNKTYNEANANNNLNCTKYTINESVMTKDKINCMGQFINNLRDWEKATNDAINMNIDKMLIRRKKSSKKTSYLMKRLNMAKLLFNTQISHKEIRAIEDLY